MRKTLSFAALHFSIAFSLAWLITGSVWVGGTLALLEPLCNTVAFHLHEKFWRRREQATAGTNAHSAIAV